MFSVLRSTRSFETLFWIGGDQGLGHKHFYIGKEGREVPRGIVVDLQQVKWLSCIAVSCKERVQEENTEEATDTVP